MAGARLPAAQARSRDMCEQLRQEGNLLFGKGKLSAAIERYTEAITLCPDIAVLYVNRALCWKKTNNVAQQKEDAEKALALDRENMKAHYLLGSAWHESGQLEQACSHLQKALDAARAKDDSIKDEIFRALAKAKLGLWESQAAVRAQSRKELQASLHAALSALPAGGLRTPEPDVVVLDDTRGAEERGKPPLPGQVQPQGPGKGGLAGARDVLQAGVQALLDAAALQDKPREVPSAFTCPLTLEPFRDPVITAAGHSYERAALLDHLHKVGHFDPISRSVQVREQDLIPNLNLRAATQTYLDEHMWAWGDCR